MTENESSSSEIFQIMEELKNECKKTYKNIKNITKNDEKSDFLENNLAGFKLKSQKAISFLQQINFDLESYFINLSIKNEQNSKSDAIGDESFNDTINTSIKTELKESEIVKNFSNVKFTEEQLSYLSKGPDYRPFPLKSPLDEIIVNIETGMRKFKMDPNDQKNVRNEIEEAIKNNQKPTNSDEKVLSELQELGEKLCYTKSDDGHKIVVINKTEYDNQIKEILENSEAFKLENINRWKTGSPLTSQQNAINIKLKYLQNEYGIYLLKYLQINPLVPEVYGICKLNANRYELEINCFRDKEILSKINDYLIEEFNKLNFDDKYSVKDSIEFANKVKNVNIADDEIMICYDFCLVFKKGNLKYWGKEVKKYFEKQTVDRRNKNMVLVLKELLGLSLDHTYVYFQNNLYDQLKGIPIGSKLCSLMKNIYMYNLEHDENAYEWFPKIWYRCVDKVFTVQKRDETLEMIENVSIIEEDSNGSIPFLDILVRREKKKFKFSIYRKSLDLERYIVKDSCHSDEEKHFWLKKLIHRYKSIPMDEFDRDDEWSKIISTAEFNGYDQSICESIRDSIQNFNNVIYQENEQTISIPFYPPLTNQIQVIIESINNVDIKKGRKHSKKKQKIDVNLTNFGTTIDILLPSTDMVKNLMKSGVYKIECNCEQIYIGETIKLKGRKKGHKKEDSAVCKHQKENPAHTMGEITLLKSCKDKDQLQAWESFFLEKFKDREQMNRRKGFVPSSLYKYCY